MARSRRRRTRTLAQVQLESLEGRQLLTSSGTISGIVFQDNNLDGVFDPQDWADGYQQLYLDQNQNGVLDPTITGTGPIRLPIDAPGAGLVAAPLTVSGFTGTLTDLDVEVNIEHQKAYALRIYLQGPDGAYVPLVLQTAGGSNLTGTVFDDQALGTIQDVGVTASPYTGRFRPAGSLARFQGLDPNGTWTLLVSDAYLDDGSYPAGTLVSWGLGISSTTTANERVALADWDGTYRFNDVPLGTYQLGHLANGYSPRVATNRPTVTLTADPASGGGTDLGVALPSTVYGRAFDDQNQNGQQDPSEPGLEGRSLYLDLNANGQLDSQTQVVASGPLNLLIPEGTWDGVNTRLTTTGFGTIDDIEVTVNLAHTYISDMILTLTSPQGITIELFNAHGGSGDNLTGTIFDDKASRSISSGTAPFTGRFRPRASFAPLKGQPIAGTWTLNLRDTYVADQGTLQDWSITVNGTEPRSLPTLWAGQTIFPNTPAGSYLVRQVPQVGWRPTAPAGGSSAITLAPGGAVYAGAFGSVFDGEAPRVDRIERTGAASTSGSTVSWTVEFSEEVVGLSLAHFALAADGPSGTTLIGLSGSGRQYTVTASTGSGDGTLRLDLVGGAGVTDQALNPLAGAPASGPAYTIDRTAPAVVEYRVLYGNGRSFNVLGSSRAILPWEITGIQVVFSEPIDAATAGSLTGVTAQSLAGVGTNVLTWGIGTLTEGRFATQLLGSGATAIRDAAGNGLGGGAAFDQAIRVLYGDVNGDGVVHAADLSTALNRTVAAYDPFADLNGDGIVDRNDVNLVRRRLGRRLSV